MKIGSLFSGIGGLELGLEWAGLGPVVWQVENEPWQRSVLAAHWPDAERFDDVRHVGAADLEPVDIICGGFPCQDISSAGKGAGLGGTRSGLWFQFERIVGELRPRWIVVENVASGAARWVDPVRGRLEKLGYETLPIPIEARHVGARHKRARVFIVANANGLELRHEQQRRPRRRSRQLLAKGQTVAGNHGETGSVDRRSASWSQWSVEPDVDRVADGVSNRLDRDRLRSLGNAVVPQCAQVVGEVINLLVEAQCGP